MSQRPDYVPLMWTQGSLNRRFQGSPRRVLVWLVASAILSVVLTSTLFATGAAAAFSYVMTVATVIGVINALIYGPRAYRAMHRGLSPDP
jgi:O-antigen/teichoic acid export membrane protein